MRTKAVFLDGFRVAVIPDSSAITELTVFNTLISRDDPGYLRRLVFPPEFRDMPADIHVDCDRDLGTLGKDAALLPDPAQAVLVMDIWADRELRILLVVRTQVLVEQVHSARTDLCVPWDEWGRCESAVRR